MCAFCFQKDSAEQENIRPKYSSPKHLKICQFLGVHNQINSTYPLKAKSRIVDSAKQEFKRHT